MHTLVYVDKQLAIAIATKLVGVLMERGSKEGAGLAFNWLIHSSYTLDESNSTTRDLREMLPEDIIYTLYDQITHKYDNVSDAVKAFAQTGENKLLPGDVITISGQLSFPSLDLPDIFDPFKPPDIEVDLFNFHGEECFVGRLTQRGFKLPIYFPESAKQQVIFAQDQPVEVTGIVRWSPPYSPGGAASLNLVVRLAALWLR